MTGWSILGPDPTNPPTNAHAASSASYSVTGLSQTTTYYWQPTCSNAFGSTQLTTPASFTTFTGGGGTTLQQTDFTYLGAYDYASPIGNGYATQGLTGRYVGGDLRLITLNQGTADGTGHYTPQLQEFSLAGKNYGDVIASDTETWNNIWNTSPGSNIHFDGEFFGLWWDAANSRLWTNHVIDYNGSYEQIENFTRTLNADGSISNLHGPVGLQNVGAKHVYGGVTPVPAYFQSAYGTAQYAIGFGGYTSLQDQVTNDYASLGLTFYIMPDPSGYTNGTEISSGSFKMLANHDDSTGGVGRRLSTDNVDYFGFDGNPMRQNPHDVSCPGNNCPNGGGNTVNVSGTTVTENNGGSDLMYWWAGYHNTQGNQSGPFQVNIDGTNYTVASMTNCASDGGQQCTGLTLTTAATTDANATLIGPSPVPTIPPDTGTDSGAGTWTNADSYYQTGVWIKGLIKEGFITIASLAKGMEGYWDSAGEFVAREFEFHIYDPTTLANAAQGITAPQNVTWNRAWVQALPGLGGGASGNSPIFNVSGAWFNVTTNKLYVMAPGVGASVRIYVFAVND
jgi:hypothetical protein